MNSYPRWFFPVLLVSLVILMCSGFLLIPTTLDTRFELDVVWRLMGDTQLIVVSTHNIVSYLMMMFVGALTTIHSRTGWRRQKNVLTGVALMSLFFLLMLSGAGLLYFGDEALILSTSVMHILAGMLISLVFIVHYLQAKLTA